MRTALQHATGDLCVVHDADLEYHPKDIARIVAVFVEDQADAVFGSRFAGGAYSAFLKKVDRFSDRPLPVSLRERENHASRLIEIDAQHG